ncbi:MAG: metallophosphoesterase family protein [Candidatus Aegiribacteria sp.]|nr:metallophosphoesterase family protein [Candidatus Aegiribacteria sp.]
MLIRLISDIHSNFQALEAVLTDPPGKEADRTFCLGDIVGYGADPSLCIERVRRECDLVVAGNHDAGAAKRVSLDRFNWEGVTAIRWTRSVLSKDEMDWISLLPYHSEHKNFFLCHSYPADPESWTYLLRRNHALESISVRQGFISLIGHTHLPGCWTEDGNYIESSKGDFSNVRIVNVGSVGQPRDRDPRAAYVLIDTEARTWEHFRVEYSIDDTAARIKDAGLPSVLWERLYRGH